MFIRYSKIINKLLMFGDFVLTVASFFIAYWLRSLPQFMEFMRPFFSTVLGKEMILPPFPLSWHIQLLYVIIPLWFILLNWFKSYDYSRTEDWHRLMWAIIKVQLAGIVGVASYNYFASITFINRSMLFMFAVINFGLIFSLRMAVYVFQNFARKHGLNFRRVIIVGSGKKALAVYDQIAQNPQLGYSVAGYVNDEKGENSALPTTVTRLGNIGDLEHLLRSNPIDDVFVALPGEDTEQVKTLINYSELLGTSFHIVPDMYEFKITKSDIGHLGALHVITYSTFHADQTDLFIKRTFDIVLSILFLPVLLLVFTVVAILIKIDSPGPVIYSQTRVTRNRRQFKFYKFRTMVADADSKLHLLDEMNILEGPIRKSKSDPRITRVGRFLRKYSIDELPQLINVIKGDMSLVGPRPPTPDEVEQYTLPQLRKLSIPQGITGLWQVSGRDMITKFEDRVAFDLKYIDTWSLLLDLKILFKTVFVVFRGAI